MATFNLILARLHKGRYNKRATSNYITCCQKGSDVVFSSQKMEFSNRNTDSPFSFQNMTDFSLLMIYDPIQLK